jgi:hypothetical protein
MKPIPEGNPDRPVRNWTTAEAEGADKMRQAKLRRQYVHASHRRKGVEHKGLAFFPALKRLLYLSMEKPKRLYGFWSRPKKIPLPERY